MLKRVAFGLKACTGRAVLVAVGGDLQQPQFIERLQIPSGENPDAV